MEKPEIKDKNVILEESKNEINNLIETANKHFKAGNLAEYNKTIAKLHETEKAYAKFYATVIYDELKIKDEPVIEAIKRYSYTIIKHKETKDDGKVAGVEKIDRDKQIDLLKFCEYSKLDTDWQFSAQKFNQLLCLRAAKELKFTPDEIKQISTSYFMAKQAADIEMGKTPDSNNALCKALQIVITALIGEQYKCNSHDVAYILMSYTKKGRAALSIAAAKHNDMQNLIMDVCYRILTDGRYSLEYKAKKA